MGSNVILHWIPSHIELRTPTEKRKIHGNDIADQLANQAAKSSDQPMDYNYEYITAPCCLTEIAKNITYSIDKKIQKIWERNRSQNAGPSNDDFSPMTGAQQFLERVTVTVTP